MVGDLIKQHGGLVGLMGLFRQKGLGEIFSSWVGLGENHPVSAEQIQQVLGDERVGAIAQRFGMDPALASSLLSKYLPILIDKLTPTGKIQPDQKL